MTPASEYPRAHFRFTLIAWTLFISVVLNFFLAGAFLGLVPHMKHKSFGPMVMAAPHGEYLVERMAHYLDPADASAFRASFKSQAAALKQAHEHVRQAINDLASAFQQDPQDATALQTALDRLTQAKGEVNDVVGKILQDAYTKISPEGRRRLADLTQNPM